MGELDLNKIYNENCLEGMNRIPDKAIDMILCDLPYGMTARNKWDIIIDFNDLWAHYKRIIKDNGAIVLTGRQPFTSLLITSNKEMFKYCLVWRKNLRSGHLNAKKRPMVGYEDIVVFYKKPPTYNPQVVPRGEGKKPAGNKFNSKTTNYGEIKNEYKNDQKERDWIYPDDVLEIDCEPRNSNIHPTQKPVKLFEWLINSYTNPGDTVLDNCMGSGTTAISCINTQRNYIGFELDKEYHRLAEKRIHNHVI